MPSFHRELVKGVATYAHELFTDHAELDVIYVPIGMGSGNCGLITVRDLLGLLHRDRRRGRGECAGLRAVVRSRPSGADQFGEDVCRWRCLPGIRPTEALDIIWSKARRAWLPSARTRSPTRFASTTRRRTISPKGRRRAAGGAAAGKDRTAGKRVGLILSGGNIDMPVMAQILGGATPEV